MNEENHLHRILFLVISPIGMTPSEAPNFASLLPQILLQEELDQSLHKKREETTKSNVENHEKASIFENFSKFCKSSSTANLALTISTLHAEMQNESKRNTKRQHIKSTQERALLQKALLGPEDPDSLGSGSCATWQMHNKMSASKIILGKEFRIESDKNAWK